MADGLAALGVESDVRPDGILIRGGRLSGGAVESRGDHRVAMAFAMAALRASGPVAVRNCANVDTSFPGFAAQAAAVGLRVREQP